MYNICAGAALVFAQFPIDQFRAIAWYNVSFGVFFLIIELFIFRGESKCHRRKISCNCQRKDIPKLTPLSVFVSSDLIFKYIV